MHSCWEDFCRKQHGNERHWTPSSLDPLMHRQQYFFPKRLLLSQQECIPVGCALSTAVAICSWGGGVCPGGWCLPRGCLPEGECLPRGFCRGCLPEGWCLPGGGVSALGWCIPACTQADTPSVDRMTDACENITLPQVRCQR